VELGRYLCEVRAGQYWRLENLNSFDEFLERRFPESRRQGVLLDVIHENLPPQVRKEMKQVGWTKGRELAKLARAENQNFNCAPWVRKARTMPREEFKREVEKKLTGRETEPHELIYFKVYRSQIPVINQAIETAALMLGSDKARGYCLEMIAQTSWPEPTWTTATPTFFCDRPFVFSHSCRKSTSAYSRPSCRERRNVTRLLRKTPRVHLDTDDYAMLRDKVLRRDGWKCQFCGARSKLEIATYAETIQKIRSSTVLRAARAFIVIGSSFK
jgi:hypothetical protein